MSIVIVGGHDRMVGQYKKICKSYKCKDIEKAKQYAEKYNLPLIHITPNLDKVYIK